MRTLNSITAVAVLGGALSYASPSRADTILVPGDYPTIQAGIDAAMTGDEVVVDDGTWTGIGNRDLDFGGKRITVRSASGDPASCIIDCDGAGRGFLFQSFESAEAVVDGFTITNGSATTGGAILCSSSSPTIRNCVIDGNSATHGGGVDCVGSVSEFDRCTFRDNVATSWGAGMRTNACALVVTDCVFEANTAGRSGGGAYNTNFSIVEFRRCAFNSNVGEDCGGAMVNVGSSNVTITDCTFDMNEVPDANGEGGAIYNDNSDPTIMRSTFTGNHTAAASTGPGGAMYNDDSSPVVTDCQFVENACGSNGGGAINNASDSNPTFTRCTFIANTSAGIGGAMESNGSSSTPTIVDCMFIDNVATSDGGALVGGSVILSGSVFLRNRAAGVGGAVFNLQGTQSITGCVFEDNVAASGGAVYTRFSVPTLTSCIFVGNRAGVGGGMYNKSADAQVRNSLFRANNVSVFGGGVFNEEDSDPDFTNCTFAQNVATDGAAIHNFDAASRSKLDNCIVWGNVASTGEAGIAGEGTATVSHSDIQGGYLGVGNIDADPLFVSFANLTLLPGSPAIDAGDNAAVPEEIVEDLNAAPRFVDDPETPDSGSGTAPIVDMGPYEFQIAAPCPEDLDGSGAVDFGDVLAVLGVWGNAGGPEDLDGSGTVDFGDLLLVLGAWGACP